MSKELREQFKKETETGYPNGHLYKDKYIKWLESKLKEADEQLKETFEGIDTTAYLLGFQDGKAKLKEAEEELKKEAKKYEDICWDWFVIEKKLQAVKDSLYGKGSHQERIEELKNIIKND